MREKRVKRIMASILVIGAFMMIGITEHVNVVHAQTAKVHKLMPPTISPQLKVKVATAGTSICPPGILHCSILTWTPPTSGATPTSYNVYRSGTQGACLAGAGPATASGCTKVGTVQAPTATFTDSPLAASTSYNYVVTSADASGESGPSNEWSTVTQADPVPNAPTNLNGQSQ